MKTPRLLWYRETVYWIFVVVLKECQQLFTNITDLVIHEFLDSSYVFYFHFGI